MTQAALVVVAPPMCQPSERNALRTTDTTSERVPTCLVTYFKARIQHKNSFVKGKCRFCKHLFVTHDTKAHLCHVLAHGTKKAVVLYRCARCAKSHPSRKGISG